MPRRLMPRRLMHRGLGGAVVALLLLTGACGEVAATDDGSDLTDLVAAHVEEDGPGCVVGVVDDGEQEVVAVGLADVDAGTPLSAGSVLDIGSVSKQMTAGALALLVVEGEVHLDDAVADVLPLLDDLDPAVTVADLVHHTSGLADYIEGIEAADDEVTDAEDAWAVILADPAPVTDPGTTFEYSNTNYFLMGQVVEALTGDSLPDFADEALFAPLGMDDARFRDDQGSLLPDQAQGYAEGDGWEPVGSAWRQTGDGAVHATITDLLAWTQPFIDGPTAAEGPGSEAWLAVMLTEGAVPDTDGTAYAGGIEVHEDGTLRHGGSWIGYSSALVMAPDDGVAVAVSCNIDLFDAEGLADEVLTTRLG